MIKSAASAASLRGGRASSRLDHVCFSLHFLAALFFGRLAAKKYQKIVKIADSDNAIDEKNVLGFEEHTRTLVKLAEPLKPAEFRAMIKSAASAASPR